MPHLNRTLLAALSSILAFTHAQSEPDRPETTVSESINVRSMGAAGDGKTDDTAAFLAAVARAGEERKPVHVPAGKYVVSKTILLEQVAITGPPGGAWPDDRDALPSILPAHRDGPAFVLGAGAGFSGLDITYHWRGAPTTGPAAIVISGIGVSVRDTRIRYAWDGIVADGVNNVGRANIENLFMVSIRNVGLRMTGTWDVPRLNNIEVWNAGADGGNRGAREGVGFHLGKNDLIRMTDCFVFGMRTGYLLESEIADCEIKGATWGVMNGCATDYCGYGIVVRGGHTLSVAGGSFWNHHASLVLESGDSRVRISGSELKTNGGPVVKVKGCDHAVVTGCTIMKGMEQHKGAALLIEGGDMVLSANHITAYGDGVVVGKGVKAAVIQGNRINSHGHEAVVDESGEPVKSDASRNLAVTGNLVAE